MSLIMFRGVTRQQVLCGVGLTTHIAGLIEKSESFQQTGLGAVVTQSFGEIIRKVTSLQGRQNVSGFGRPTV